MKKFEGILIASDWDGTLCLGSVTQKNIDAIKYFQENGGKFTICSGRHYNHVKKNADVVKPNTYVISLNGAVICDIDTNEILYTGVCDDNIYPIIKTILSFKLYTSMYIFFEGESNSITFSVENFENEIKPYNEHKIYKVVFVTDTSEKGELGAQLTNEIPLGDYIAVRSWDKSIEIMMKKNSKGYALLKLKEKIGAKIAIAVGDYENDIAMLEVADISYAVSNACDKVKSIAKRQTSAVTEASIADVIADLEKELQD